MATALTERGKTMGIIDIEESKEMRGCFKKIGGREGSMKNILKLRCFVCGKLRENNKLSVRITGCVTYCNDNPDCVKKSKTFSFVAA